MRKALLNLLERKHTLSVPPQVEDADMVLSDAIEELLEARKKIALLDPLRNAWISELERRETLRDRGDSWKVLEPMTDDPALTHEIAERTANALLVQYEEPKPAEGDEEAFFAIGLEFPLPIPEGATHVTIYRGDLGEGKTYKIGDQEG